MTPAGLVRRAWFRCLLACGLLLMLCGALPLAAEEGVPAPLIVAQDHAWPPFAFLGSDGEPQGALIEVWQDIGERLDRPVEFLLLDWPDTIEAVKDGRAHVHGGLFRSREREIFLDFGEPLLPLSSYVFVTGNLMAESVEQLEGITVGATSGSYELEVMRERYPEIPIRTFDNNDLMVRAALRGELEAFVADYPVGLYLLDRHGDPTRFRPMSRLYAEHLLFAVAAGEGDLRRELNRAVQDLGPEGVRRSAQLWVRSETVEVMPGWIWPLLPLVVLGPAIGVLYRDQRLLKRRVAEQTRELEEREALFRTLSDSSAAGVFICVGDTIRAANRAMARLVGVPIKQLLNKPYLSLVPEEDRAHIRERVERIVTEGKDVGRYEDRVLHRDGHIVWVEVMASRALYRGQPALVGTLVDITERKRFEQIRARQLGIQNLLAEASSMFIQTDVDGIDAVIDFLLSESGQMLQANRAYLFQFWGDGTYMTNTHEWCAPDAESVFEECQNLRVADMPWWQEQMEVRIWRHDLLWIPDLNELPSTAEAERHFLGSQGVRSMLCVPVGRQGQVTGFFGFDYFTPQDFSSDELQSLLLLSGLLTEALERNRLDRALRHESRTDGLTGLFNRRYLDARLASLLLDDPGEPFALAMLDLDHFKDLNDAHGHLAGDAVLKSVAKTLRRGQRRQDVVVRYGGEEFAILMPAANVDDAVQAANRFIEAVREMVCRYDGREFRITASAGVAASCELQHGQDSARALLAMADRRLYRAKALGRDRVCGDDGEGGV